MLPKALSIGKSIGLEAGSRLRRTAAVIQQKFNGKKNLNFFTNFIQKSEEQRGWRVNINFISRTTVGNIRIVFRIILSFEHIKMILISDLL